VQFLSGGVVGVAADDGAFLWRYDHPANSTANISTPVFHDGGIFAASAYGTGGGLVRLTRDGPMTRAVEVYFTKKMENHHGGMVVVDSYLYGANGGQLACLEFSTGKVQWQSRTPGKGSILFADGRLYYRNEGGEMYLIEANPHQYVEHGRFMPPDRSQHNAWAHPVQLQRFFPCSIRVPSVASSGTRHAAWICQRHLPRSQARRSSRLRRGRGI
jgi:outer membrane protein assembly factor BamB